MVQPPAQGGPLRPAASELTAARAWPVSGVSRETLPGGPWQLHLVCALAGCGQSIACLAPDASRGSFIMTPDDICFRVLAHLKVCHADSVPVI